MTPSLLATGTTLAELLEGSPYQSYVYAYPHKTAYRRFSRPFPLSELWADEPQQSLSLYLHVPFCEYRCGFCNLFTRANPAASLPGRFLESIQTEAAQVRKSLPEANFARIAIGGGTPTFLSEPELLDLLHLLTEVMGAKPADVPFSCEASPATVDPAKLDLLKSFGVDRLSLGVQAFDDAASNSLGRPQSRQQTERGLEMIREARFSILNLDLIYGGQSQSSDDWQRTVKEALAWQPEELYLYPLYVRPLTGLGRRDQTWDDQRLSAYRSARDILRTAGYTQISMRMFRSPGAERSASPVYCCQEDGMLGLGPGARSYTSGVHYSTEYAVGRAGIDSILIDYLNRKAQDFSQAHYGDGLPEDDQRRRYVLLSLLQCEGLSRTDYQRRFGGDILEHFPACQELEPAGLANVTGDRIVLTEQGIELSDAIGPWLYSDRVRRLMNEHQPQ